MFVCEVCQKEYKSRSGLRRHVKSKHPSTGLRTGRVAVPMIDVAGGGEGSEATKAGALRPGSGQVGPASERSDDRLVLEKEAKRACKALGIKQADVMAFRVYHDHEPLKVVLIEGPVGWKRVWLDK